MGKRDFEEKELTTGLMVRMKNLLWSTGNVVVMDSGVCVLEGLFQWLIRVFWGWI